MTIKHIYFDRTGETCAGAYPGRVDSSLYKSQYPGYGRVSMEDVEFLH